MLWSQRIPRHFSSRILRRVGSMVLMAIEIWKGIYGLRNAWSLFGYIVLSFPFFLLSLRAILEVSMDLLVSLASSSVFFSLNPCLSASSVYPSLLPLYIINMSLPISLFRLYLLILSSCWFMSPTFFLRQALMDIAWRRWTTSPDRTWCWFTWISADVVMTAGRSFYTYTVVTMTRLDPCKYNYALKSGCSRGGKHLLGGMTKAPSLKC